MTRKLWDAWTYQDEEWKRIPLGSHKDAEGAREYADAYLPYVSQIVQVSGRES